MYIVPNGGIGVDVPERTKRKLNSAARIVVGVPSTQTAVTGFSAAADAHSDGRRPKPMHAKPVDVYMACVADVDEGLLYSIAMLFE